jgi:hypothetical protein
VSQWNYKASQHITSEDWPFYVLIIAAMLANHVGGKGYDDEIPVDRGGAAGGGEWVRVGGAGSPIRLPCVA